MSCAAAVMLSGCGAGNFGTPATEGASVHIVMSGKVHGGQQPVSGASVYLYAASSTSNAGAATSLLAGPGYVTTDANGNFSITGDYTCPAGAYVYLLATGGNPGLAAGTNNQELALADGLGPCSSLTASSFYTINEVSTVATAFALANFATSETQIGADPSNNYSFVNAFATIPNLINPSSGMALTVTPAGNGVVPQAKIDSLADALAPCVNSDGTGAACSSLMSAANVSAGGATPVDTFQAILNIAHSPTSNVGAIYNLTSSNVPFQPQLTSAPSDWRLTIQSASAVTASLSPSSTSVAQGGSQSFTVSVSGTGGNSVSYRWTTSGAAGLLNEVGGSGQVNQTSYCSSSAQTIYTSNAAPVLNASVTDTVTVQVFGGSGCVAANLLSSSAAAPVVVVPSAANTTFPAFPTNVQTSTIVLPPGSQLTPDQLTVVNGVTQVGPAPSGTFSIPVYSFGSQIVVVQSPSGNPMLMGWMDATHSTISAQSTAEVLAFYAFGGPLMLQESDKNALEADILNAPGLQPLAQVIASEIAADPDILLQTDANVQNALNTFWSSISGLTPENKRASLGKSNAARPNNSASGSSGSSGTGMLIDPGTQSGVLVAQTDSGNAADAINSYRRRVHVFVQRVSDRSSSGTVTADAADVTDFELSPTVGVNGGVAGALSDVFNYYWGNSTAAYAPVTSDPFSVPVTSGYAQTTYQVTVVGPGRNTSTYASLTDVQAATQGQVSVEGFVYDAAYPFLANFVFGSGFFPPGKAEAGLTGSVVIDQDAWKQDLLTDFTAALAGYPSLKAQILSGDWYGALAQVLDNVRQSGVFRDAVIDALGQAAGAKLTTTALQTAFAAFSKYLNAAGGALQAFDTSVYLTQLGMSDAADQWTLINGGQKVTLSPTATQITQYGGSTPTLTANLPGLESTSGFSYLWTSTGSAGTLLPLSGSGSSGTTFCSSSSTVSYNPNTSPVLAMAVTDQISVEAFSAPGCNSASALGTSPAATVTVNPEGVALAPGTSSIQQTGQQTLTATVNGGNGSNYTFEYMVTGNAGLPPVGTISDGNTSGTTIACSSSTSVTYTPNPSPTLTFNATDGVSVQAFLGPNCQPKNSIGTSIPASIEVTASGLLLSPRNPRIGQTAQVNIQATLQLGSGTTSTGSVVYQWTVTGSGGAAALGTLGDAAGDSGASFCTSSNQVTYTPNASPDVTFARSDSLTAQAFSGSACTSSAALSPVVSTSITVMPAPTERDIPLTGGEVGILEASDGNYYGIAVDGATVSPSSTCSPDCGAIYRITPSGVESRIYTFPGDGTQGYVPANILEGSDGALYGISGSGGTPLNPATLNLFRLTLAGSASVVGSTPTPVNYVGVTSIMLGNDGAFYALTQSNAIASSQQGIMRVDTSGNFSFPMVVSSSVFGCAAEFVGTQFAAASSLIQDASGAFDFQAVADNYCPNLPFNEGGFVSVSASGEVSFVPESPQQYAYFSAASDFSSGVSSMAEGPGGNFYGILSQTFTNGTQSADGAYVTNGIYQAVQTRTPLVMFEAPLLPNSIAFNPNLLLASDGNLYGSAINNIFNVPVSYFTWQMTPAGNFANLGSSQQYGTGSNSPCCSSAFGNIYIQNDAGALVGTYPVIPTQTSPATSTLYELGLVLPPPIQLVFSQSTTAVNQPVTLTWTLPSAFSMTAQQCYASVQGDATGAGLWTGKQYGSASSNGWSGATTIKPTSAGTYTYALTCGGTQSGFATLTVQ